MHWGWYWKIKRQDYQAKSICESYESLKLDSFSMFNDYKRQVMPIRESADKCVLHIPGYNFKAYLQDNDDLLVVYRNGTYTIPVERMPCNYGGYYYFFHCPKCDKRMRKLYCFSGQYLCRKCGNLAYYSQRLRPTERLWLQHSDKITQKIKLRGGDFHAHVKPPRMHRKTFQAYEEKSEYIHAKRLLAELKETREWYSPKAMRYFDGYFEWEAQFRIEDYQKKYFNK